MVVLLGLFLGFVIGTTGVGGGVLTAPALILLFGAPPARAVGTALVFSAAVKVNAALLYVVRRHVDFRCLAWLLAGGIPGACAGALLLETLQSRSSLFVSVVGAIVAVSAACGLLHFRTATRRRERPKLLALLSIPIGAEVGFSSAGAGALGTVLLFGATKLPPVAVVGTDIMFGLGLSLTGGALHAAAGSWNTGLLMKLLLGGLPGVYAGTYLAGKLPARPLRTAVLAWAMLLGLLLVYKGLDGGF